MTGSFFGEAVKQARVGMEIPVATSFEGIVERAFELERPLHVLATAPDSATLLAEELGREAAARGRELSIARQAVDGAMDALIGGRPRETRSPGARSGPRRRRPHRHPLRAVLDGAHPAGGRGRALRSRRRSRQCGGGPAAAAHRGALIPATTGITPRAVHGAAGGGLEPGSATATGARPTAGNGPARLAVRRRRSEKER